MPLFLIKFVAELTAIGRGSDAQVIAILFRSVVKSLEIALNEIPFIAVFLRQQNCVFLEKIKILIAKKLMWQ